MATEKKAVKKTKAAPAINEQAVQFVRDHVQVRLQRMGFSPEKAESLVACCSDDEICGELPTAKKGMQAIGDGSWLKWLKDHKDEIQSAVQKIVDLIGLVTAFGATPAKGIVLPDEECEPIGEDEEEEDVDEDEEEAEEDDEEEETEEEDEEEEEEAPKKRRR